MTHSVIEVTCKECKAKINGVLNDIFSVSNEYSVTCPSCEKQIFFKGGAEVIDAEIPENSAQVMYATDPVNAS